MNVLHIFIHTQRFIQTLHTRTMQLLFNEQTQSRGKVHPPTSPLLKTPYIVCVDRDGQILF